MNITNKELEESWLNEFVLLKDLEMKIKKSNHNNWETPKKYYNELNKEFNFNFDPCPLNASEDGLNLEWGTRTFVNPPYGRGIGDWVKKSYEESQIGKLVVMLMPVRTDTKYFHNYILGKAEIRFIKGRLKFKGYSKMQKKIVDDQPASFPCMTVIFNPTSTIICKECFKRWLIK